MAAGLRDLVLEQGATTRFALQWLQPTDPPVPYDITGAKARMQLRTGAGELLVDLSDGDGIELGTTDGMVRVTIPPSQTWKLDVKRVRYDLFLLLPGGDVVKLLKGRGLVDKAVTDYRDALSVSASGEPVLVYQHVGEPDPVYQVSV